MVVEEDRVVHAIEAAEDGPPVHHFSERLPVVQEPGDRKRGR
jgi:hypothetical protein